MIDSTGGINPGFGANTEIRFRFPGFADAQGTALPSDCFTSASSSKNESFIIIPPKDFAQKASVTSARGQSLPGDITVKDELPVVGGFVAEINQKTRKELTNAGFIVFQDKNDNTIPVTPDFPPDEAKPVDKSPTGIPVKETVAINERPPLEGPRFDTPLTRQYTGKSVTIAIIDSGLYPHPDFLSPENRILEFVDFVNGRKVPYDDNGHGTHVAGDAAGNGNMSKGLFKGPASEAKIVALKALSGSGSGKTSDILKAIQWCIENKEKYNIRVLNMSLGHLGQKDFYNDPTDIAVKKAYEAGIVVVCSGGNKGPGPETISAPGDCPCAISVGAVDDWNTYNTSDDKVTKFSSRGPSAGGLMKPDIVAPGEAIISTMAPGTSKEANARKGQNMKESMRWFSKMSDEELKKVPEDGLKLIGLADETIEKWKSSPDQARKEIKRIFEASQRRLVYDEAYISSPGTSMASPIVAGVVAEMLDANPDLTPGQVARILKSTADKLPGEVPVEAQGFGMIDPDEAIQKALDVKAGLLTIPEPQIVWPEGPPPQEDPAAGTAEQA